MSLIVTVCGRKFLCAPGSTALQEVSEEVRQHLHGPTRLGAARAASEGALLRRAHSAAQAVGRSYAAMKVRAIRAAIAARPVLQVALGL
jgi:hypothetical protein